MCIQRDGGSYYPGGIYLGGDTSRNLVRAIDASVIDLFARAERTANTGENNTSGGISQTSYTAVSTNSSPASLQVLLEPVRQMILFRAFYDHVLLPTKEEGQDAGPEARD